MRVSHWDVVNLDRIKSLRYKTESYIKSHFHLSAHKNTLAFQRHSSFIYSNLLSSLVALVLYPLYLYRSDLPAYVDLMVLLWFLSPLAIVAFVCRTGNLAIAHLISSLNLALFIIIGASFSGGINSFLIAWLIIVPLEAALSGHRKVIFAALFGALFALACLYTMGQYNLVFTQQFSIPPELLLIFGLSTALLYGTSIAMSVQRNHEEANNVILAGEQKYRLMADHATDLITVHDEHGMVTFVSPAATSIIGDDPESLLGAGMLQYIHVSDRPTYMTGLSNCCHNDSNVNFEFRLRRKNSDTGQTDFVWVEMRCQAVRDKLSPNATKIISVTRDITSHKTQEIALLEAREKAESANVAKTRFLANMSHELRTPLNAIIGFSDVLNMELFGKINNQKYSDYSRLINEAGGHLLGVVNNILDMSKIEVGKFTIHYEQFEISPLIQSCCDMLEPMANENNVSIAQEFNAPLTDVLADRRAMMQMVINLLSNAIKFSRSGSKVIVRSDCDHETFYVDVIDQGIGISQGDIPKLCNPFVQVDNSYKREHEGVGLGLSVVKGLAQLHNGSLKIESTLGKGTTVRIEFPLIDKMDVSPSEELEISSHEEQKGKIVVAPFIENRPKDLKFATK